MPEDEEALAGLLCPTCELEIPPERYSIHLAGLDAARLECPRQDVAEIKRRQKEPQPHYGSWASCARDGRWG
jgi:hypothetical protein